MRYIDADALMDQLTRKKAPTGAIRHTEGFNDALMRMRSMVHSAPTVQLPELTPDPVTGLVPCGCGGELVLHNCSGREFMTTFYVQCGNEVCRMSIGRHYDPINHCRRGEFTDAKSAVKAANRAMGYKGGAE